MYGPQSVYDPSKWAGGNAHKVGMSPESMVSGGGVSFGEPADLGVRNYGWPEAAKGSFSSAAGYLLGGAQQGKDNLMRSYEMAYRGQAQGMARAQREMNDRMGGEVASQGYNPDLVRRMTYGQNMDTQAQIGAAYGQNQADMFKDFAEIANNLGVSLADLKLDQFNAIMQAYQAKMGRKSAEKAGWINLAGSAAGAAAGAYGAGA